MSETKEKSKEKTKEKCFVIMPISDQGDYPAGHFTKVYEQIIKPAVEETGYEAYRVDENNICDPIINKIFSAIQECPMAICDLSNRNPNVLYELGLRQAYDKPVVLIQDEKTQKIFDVSGISTVYYNSTRLYEEVLEARENIKKAILSTKEGKISTLAKIVKVNAADFSKVEVSQNDKMNVILEGIYSEIRGLKDREKTELRNSVRLSDGSSWVTAVFGCNDYERIEQLRRESWNNLPRLDQIFTEKISDDKWRIRFKFVQQTSIKKVIEVISKIATELNLEFDERDFGF